MRGGLKMQKLINGPLSSKYVLNKHDSLSTATCRSLCLISFAVTIGPRFQMYFVAQLKPCSLFFLVKKRKM